MKVKAVGHPEQRNGGKTSPKRIGRIGLPDQENQERNDGDNPPRGEYLQ